MKKKKTISQDNMDSLNKDDVLVNNKYFKAILVSYYSLTRDEDILVAMEKLEDYEYRLKIFQEYQLYLAGFEIDMGEQVDGSLNIPIYMGKKLPFKKNF